MSPSEAGAAPAGPSSYIRLRRSDPKTPGGDAE